MVFAIINRRGGVAKTATSHALGAGLPGKVLFVDLDPQSNLSYDVGAEPARYSVMDVLMKSAPAANVIQHTKGGDILPASPGLATADIMIDGTGKEYRLKEALEGLAYDHIVIDTPPALGVLTINALTASDTAIIPAQAEIHSLQGIGLLNESIEAVRKYTNPSLFLGGIVCTRYNGRTIISRDMLDNLQAAADELGTKLYKTPIRECVSIREAQALRKSIFEYAPGSNAAKDYRALIDEIMEGLNNE